MGDGEEGRVFIFAQKALDVVLGLGGNDGARGVYEHATWGERAPARLSTSQFTKFRTL